jgi:hypothetical protein
MGKLGLYWAERPEWAGMLAGQKDKKIDEN